MAGGADRPPAIIVHSGEQALIAAAIAVELGRPVTLRSPAGAVSSLGVGWFTALTALLREQYPALDVTFILDCGDEAGTAMAAFRRGIALIRFTGPAEVTARLAGIAAEKGAALDQDLRPTLDLSDENEVEKQCREWLRTT